MKDFIIPKMGMGTSEAEIIEWKVNVGDRVEKGDIIVEVVTEKANAELESDTNGIIAEILYKKNDFVESGSVICKIKED